ncbi:DUF7547 family protein [Halobellus limi]|uniref:Uncharacterized protein n=1 Tax=Halobellus limi TaxID=699433 RepID=A0A1H6ATQ0_9EURY|nr:hypothetical protein [Halobellus limi]SEG52043.1 hypothetical protein SAMN04488133_2515 [Halobellus limi]
MPPADRDDDLRDLVDELEATLTDLRGELREGGSGEGGRSDPVRDRAGRRAGPARRSVPERPRPPSLSELFRFTEQYTLPTLIATLETAIQSLELLRGVLRLADPERSAFDPENRSGRSSAARMTDGVAGVGRGAVTGVERALSELQTALSESELPEDEPARDLLEDARRLSEEVSERLAEASGERERGRSGSRRASNAGGTPGGRSAADASGGSGPVEIEVTDAGLGAEDETTDEEGDDGSDSGRRDDGVADDAPEVDVEAELASIKEEVEPRAGRGGAAEDAGGEAAEEAGDNADEAGDDADKSGDNAGEAGDDADKSGDNAGEAGDDADGTDDNAERPDYETDDNAERDGTDDVAGDEPDEAAGETDEADDVDERGDRGVGNGTDAGR